MGCSKEYPTLTHVETNTNFIKIRLRLRKRRLFFKNGLRIKLSEDMINMLDAKLAMLYVHTDEMPKISVTYFVPNLRQDGGKYVTVCGNVKEVNRTERVIVMQDGTRIPTRYVRYIEGDLFESFW